MSADVNVSTHNFWWLSGMIILFGIGGVWITSEFDGFDWNYIPFVELLGAIIIVHVYINFRSKKNISILR